MTTLRMPRVVAVLLCLSACAFALESDKSPAEAKLSPQRAAVEKMLTERGSAADFDKAVAAAKKQGATEQAMLEANFLYLVDRHDDDKLVALLPRFLEQKDKFNLSESEIFAVHEDWLAVVEYLQALAALKKSDKDGFKKHITEAFWLSPRQGSAFAPHIDRLRLDEAMKGVKVDAASTFETMSDEKISFADLAKEKKGVVLHFWSPWSRECEESMPDFKVVAAELAKSGFGVASLLVESSPEILTDATALMSSLGDTPPGKWLKGDAATKVSHTLRIQNVPAMVLLSADGAVIYNGEPSDAALWSELKKLSPEIKRPSLPQN